MLKTTLFCSLFCFLSLHFSFAQDCADAGSDRFVCGFDADLIANPPGGYWTTICNPESNLVMVDSMFPGGVRVRVTACGEYEFVYHIDQGNCISTDTIKLMFENRNFRLQETQHTISLSYQANPCHTDPTDSCGPIRVLNGFLPLTPLWRFSIKGECETYQVEQNLFGVDSANCTVDSITQDILVSRDTARLNWVTTQPPFIELDESGNILKNDIQSFIGIITQALLDELDQKCPLMKCFSDPKECLDTFQVDTFKAFIPVHLGGNWYYNQGNQSQRLTDLSVIDINGEEFILSLPNGGAHYGPEPIIFELYSSDGSQSPIPLNSIQRIQLQWKEEWKYDTIEYYIYREISDMNCPCQGTTILGNDLVFPTIPNFFCPPVQLIFAPNVDASISGNLQFCQGDFTELTGPEGLQNYQWNDGTGERSTFVSTPGTIILLVEDQRGCFGTDTVEVIELSQPDLQVVVENPILCKGECTQVLLSSSPENKLIWENRDTVSMIEVCPNLTSLFRARSLSPDGCTHDTLVRIQVFEAPDPGLGSDQTLTCLSTAVQLDVTRPDTFGLRGFYWDGPGIDFSNRFELKPSLSTPGTYVFHVVDSISGCIGTDTIQIFIDTLAPLAFAGADQLLNCKDSTVFLIADSTDLRINFYWEWSGPDILASRKNDIVQGVRLPGQYILRVQNLLNECERTDTVLVFLNRTMASADAGLDRVLPCDSASITIGGNFNSTGSDFKLSWTGPGIDSTNRDSIAPKISVSGTYVIRVVNFISLCEETDSVLVTFPDSLPMVILTKTSDLNCKSDTVFLDASLSTGRNLKFFWAGPNISDADRHLKKIIATKEGKYYILIRDTVLNCEYLDSIIITKEDGQPLISAGLDKSITCDFVSVVLDGTFNITPANADLSWTGPGINSGNRTQRNPTVDQPGIYVLKVEDKANGCESFDTVNVLKNLNIPLSFLGVDRTLSCKQDTLDIYATLVNYKTTYTFNFKGPGINGTQERNIRQIIRIPGTYVSRIITPNPECLSSDTLVVDIDTMVHSIGLPNPIWFSCQNRTVTFSVSDFSLFDSISWRDVFDRRMQSQDLGKTVTFVIEGKHTYRVFQKNGCDYSGTVTVQPYATIVLDKVELTHVCGPVPNGTIRILIKDGVPPIRYSVDGSPKDLNNYYTGLDEGLHLIRIFDQFDCQYDTTVFIRKLLGLPLMYDSLRVTQTICKDTSINAYAIFQASGFPYDSARFEWRDERGMVIGRDSVQNFMVKGNYVVVVFNKNGCDSIKLFFNLEQDESLANQKVHLPNVFTPNGDMENDTYKVVFDQDAIFEKDGFSLKIYNRWGQLVFESNDPDEAWDGYYRGQLSPMDSYIVQFIGTLDICGANRLVELKTSLSLIR
ncbi:MAG: gliding motility-associated C-terminal domain-containing protein [Saprospiraceae bacterium]|nr:gliding motility-associated C-terminal domain-containing protein [Saprospiraceae bacterium]